MKNNTWMYLLLISLMVNTGYAQRFKAGVQAGLLATQVDGDDHNGYKKPGVFLGVFGNFPFPNKKSMKLQMEINYAQKGSKSPSSDASPYKIALHQIEVPVLFGWTFLKELALEIGPSVDIIAKANESVNNELVPANSGGSKFNLIEIGGIFGLNYTFKEHFGLSVRVNYSLSPIGRSVVLRDGGRKFGKYMWNNALLFRFYYQF